MDKTKAVVVYFALVVYIFPIRGHEKLKELIYILLWTYTNDQSWIYRDLEMGQKAFKSRNCHYQNCFITHNRSYFNNVLDYNVLIFNAFHFSHFPSEVFALPPNRTPCQQYVLACVEPSSFNRLYEYLDGVFNLTWTYKLNSDIVHPYYIVKNKFGEIIGPKLDTPFMNATNLPSTNRSIIEKLKNKSIAAVWVGSNCYAKERIIYILKLQKELRSKYGLQLDMFGRCGNNTVCRKITPYSRGYLTNCYDRIESYYYFYLAFENSLSEDYVTEKVLHGLNHFTVPIVYGGADYQRFLPDGIYLDAVKLGVKGLAKEMYDIINDPPRYYDFFKWHGYYTFHDPVADNYSYTVCELCAFLNKERRKHNKTVRIYKSIVDWWNSPAAESFPSFFSFLNISNETTFSDFPSTEPNTVPTEVEPEASTSFVSEIFNFVSNVLSEITQE